jgi:hypothetical protein
MRSVLATLAVGSILTTLVSSGPALAAPPGQEIADASQLREAIMASIDPQSDRDAVRVPRATVDPSGDVTVVFALRSEGDDPAATHATALADTLAILRAVYQSAEADRVSTATVIGTYPVQGKQGTVRELPVLRAVLSAARANQLDAAELSPEDVPPLLDAWWLHGAFVRLSSPPQVKTEPDWLVPLTADQGVIPVDAEGRPHEPLSLPQVQQQVELMLVHLNEALFAMSGNEARIARSQFKQFFEEWDRAEEEISELYGEQHDALDLELQRAETALLHFPQDLDTARGAIRALRAGLLDLARDLEGRLGL